jgi:hypothetical protein
MFTRNLPIFLVFGAALVIGVGAIIYALASGDEEQPPSSTISQFGAERAAKMAYFDSDPTVSPATCTAQEYVEATDTWNIECVLERGELDAVVRTRWVVTPDGVAKRVNEAAAPS